jgi:hypothetical protein
MGKGFRGYLLSSNCLLHYNVTTVQGWYLVANSSLHSYIIWEMYILGLSSSWGTSRICPAWSPCEHQLTPALSPIWGPRPKPNRPEEVVYSSNDSCSHFTQRLFPPILPQQPTCTIPYCTFNIIHIYYTSHSRKQLYLLFTCHVHSFISSDLHSRPAALGPLCPIQ